MKANAIAATLLVVAAVHADARFASPYPRKAVAPGEGGGWIVINGNVWPHSAESESDRRTVAKEASRRPSLQKVAAGGGFAVARYPKQL